MFYQRGLDYRPRARQARGPRESVTRFRSDRKPSTSLSFLSFVQVLFSPAFAQIWDDSGTMHMICFQDAVSGGGRDDDSRERRPASKFAAGHAPKGVESGGLERKFAHARSQQRHAQETDDRSKPGRMSGQTKCAKRQHHQAPCTSPHPSLSPTPPCPQGSDWLLTQRIRLAISIFFQLRIFSPTVI